MKRKKNAKKDSTGNEVVEESKTQALTTIAKVVNLSDDNALVLGLAGYVGTKVWNVANHDRREKWTQTGKIPSFADQCKSIKQNCWYKLLPSQSSQEILGELADSYDSWFGHRKNGDLKANPPGFRKKDTLSTLTFKQAAFDMLGDQKINLHFPATYTSRRVIIEYNLPRDVNWGKSNKLKLCMIRKQGIGICTSTTR